MTANRLISRPTARWHRVRRGGRRSLAALFRRLLDHSVFRAFAAEIHSRLAQRADGNGGGSAHTLLALTETLGSTAPSQLHRAVAQDLLDALSDGNWGQALSIARTAEQPPDLWSEKIVSRKYRYVWLCVPKVASRSIGTLLCEIDPDAELTSGSIHDVYAMYPEARNYTSFAFVRDPYYRAFSFYANKYLDPDADKIQMFIEPFHGASPTFSFDDLCQWLNTPFGSDAFADRHWLSQSSQVVLSDGRWADFIGRYDNLDADFRTVCDHLGMPARKLPRLKKMGETEPDEGPEEAERKAQRIARLADENLNEQNKALLRKRYAEDFKLLRQIRDGCVWTGDRRPPAVTESSALATS